MDDSDKAIKHVEVILRGDGNSYTHFEIIEEEVRQWLLKWNVYLGDGQQLQGYNDLPQKDLIDSVHVCEYTGPDDELGYHKLTDVYLDVHAYSFQPNRRRRTLGITDDDIQPDLRTTNLPSQLFQHDWDKLIFDDSIRSRLLKYVTNAMRPAAGTHTGSTANSMSKTILLHGPPGTGKTTLCRALAQKATVRAGTGAKGKLVEVHASSLLSKYFGESGKMVRKAFTGIAAIAASSDTFVYVLFDEVESLTGSRQSSITSGECRDGFRATNEFLTALDDLRRQPNVIVLCTSNMANELDSAFTDRVKRMYIPLPGAEARYNILRSSMTALQEIGKIQKTSWSHESDGEPEWVFLEEPEVPMYASMLAHALDQHDSLARQIWNLAQITQGMSGRKLAGLPSEACAELSDACSLEAIMRAMEKAVADECLHKDEQKVDHMPATSRSSHTAMLSSL